MTLIYILLGVAGGLLSGLLGIGGGVLLVPALVFLSFPQKEAQGISLAVMVPMVIIGAIRYKINSSIDPDLSIALLISIGAVVGVFCGTWLVDLVTGLWLRRFFAAILLIIAVRMLFSK